MSIKNKILNLLMVAVAAGRFVTYGGIPCTKGFSNRV